LGGGYILLGIAEDNGTLFPQYKSVHIDDPDKVQSDFVTQCSSMFNIPIRPKVSVETVVGNTVIKIKIDELPANCCC
jgi:ATP-dependent DNA helicase RecG